LKADLIKSLLKDFTGLKEFSLSFASDDSKKREINPLLQAILTTWKQVEFMSLENFQYNVASYSDN